jgi:hypothetical protein
VSEQELRRGDLVEVRSAGEILDTLDELGAHEGMPFMPEMVPFCGGRFEVDRRVERVCDTLNRAQWSVQLASTTVYLDGLRCDGSAHGGCQATCRFFWHADWLKPVDDRESATHTADDPRAAELLARVAALTTYEPEPSEVRFRCQATELPSFSARVSAKDPRQYIREYTSGNVRLRTFATVMARATVMQPLQHFGRLPNPPVRGASPRSPKTAPLDLQPGEWVRVKSKDQIAQTLTDRGMNRGLWFDREMLPFCGRTFRVERRIDRIIDEATGKMIALGNDCIVLENAFCSGERSVGRWFCPRETPPYWRECWLERVPPQDDALALTASDTSAVISDRGRGGSGA